MGTAADRGFHARCAVRPGAFRRKRQPSALRGPRPRGPDGPAPSRWQTVGALLTVATLAAAPVAATPAAGTTAAGAPVASRTATAAVGSPLPTVPAADDAASPLQVPRFETVGRDRIPRAAVASAVQDAAGFLWVATGDGVVRHDGERFDGVERDDAEPLRRNLGWVRAMAAGRDGRVWIGTEGDGVVVHDPVTGRTRRWGGDDGASGPGSTVRALAVDDAAHALWVGTQDRGLQRLDTRDPRVRRTWRHADTAALPGDGVRALALDAAGTLWVGTDAGLVRRRARGGDTAAAFEPVPWPGGGDAPAVQALHADADGRLWVGTRGGEVALLDTRAAAPVPRVLSGGRAGAVTALQTAGGALWVGRDTGLEQRDGVDGALQRLLQHDPRQPGALGSATVTALLRDHAGTLWVGGIGIGLQRHRPQAVAVQLRSADADPASPFADANVRALAVQRDGKVWAGVPGRGVVVFDRDLRARARWPLPGALGVDAMTPHPDGGAWVAAQPRLLWIDAAGRVRRDLALAGPALSLRVDAAGTLWATGERGLLRLGPHDDAPHPVPFEGPSADQVTVTADAPDGSLWVGTSNGLYRLARAHPGDAVAPRLTPLPDAPGAGLGNRVVIGLTFDRHGRPWADTAVTGLHRLAGWRDGAVRWDRVSLRHGLYGPPFGANLLEDAQGRIWTQQAMYDPQADRVHPLPSAGRDGATGWFHSHGRLPDGRLVFGTSVGLLVVDPARWQPPPAQAPLVLTSLRVDGRARAAGGAPAVALRPGERGFDLEFAALDLDDPGRWRYAVRLEGYDPDWVPVRSGQRSAAYGNLDPGRYRLHVRAQPPGGEWGDARVLLAATVLPPWWATAWARAAAAVLALGLALQLLRRRTAALRRRQRELESLVDARTAELAALAERLRESSLTDPLTGLRNRRFVHACIDADEALARRRHEEAARSGQAAPDDADLVLLLVDIDHFKAINDTHGHAAGDAVLVQLRQRLATVVREGDDLVRWGGEEFLLLARGTARGHAASLAARVCQAVASMPFPLGGGTGAVADAGGPPQDPPPAATPVAGAPAAPNVAVTVSVGYAACPLSLRDPAAGDWRHALALADAALYRAKAAGRNRWAGVRTIDPCTLPALAAPGDAAAWLAAGRLAVDEGGPAPPGTRPTPTPGEPPR